jgi:hypothetical protein
MDVEKEDNLLCKGCNNPISKYIKFCSKCGTKNESNEDYTEPASMDYDDSVNNDYTVVADESNYTKKPASKKGIKYAVIAGAIILISLLSINVFGKTLFPDKYVKGAILNTYNAINKNNKEFKDMPGIVSYLTQANEVNENEIFVKFEDFGGGIDRYLSNMLNDYGLKLNLKNDLKNNLFSFNIGLLDGKSEIASAEMYGSNEYLSLGIPVLYDGYLGVNANSEIMEETYGEYDMIKNNITIFAKQYKAVNESKSIITKKAENLSKELISLIKFEKGSLENTYIANINGEEFLDIIERYILELINEESIKNAIFYTSYMEDMNYLSYEEVKSRFDELIEEIPVELKYYMNEINLDDIEISIAVNDKKLVNDFQIQTKLSNEYEETVKLKASGKINNTGNGIKSNYDLKLATEYDSFSVGAYIENSENNKNLLNKTIEINMDSSTENTISFEINEEYDSSGKACNSSIILSYGSSYQSEIPILNLKSKGIFDGKDRINFDSIDLIFNEDDYYTYELNLSGYIQNKDVKSVNKIDSKSIKFINELSEDDVIELIEDIEANMQLLSNEIF